MPLLALLAVPLLFGLGELYPWARAGYAGAPGKAAYLNVPFFIARLAVYFAVWGWIGRFYLRRSLAQDASGDPSLTTTMRRRSAPAMIVFALTLTFAAFDLLMSLDPGWYSTIFGVYYFAGAAVGVYALLPLAVFLLQRAGFIRRSVTVEHYHDLGKLLFGFVVFWAYIAFSQYMLMWYANLPEETHWFVARQQHGWGWVGLALRVRTLPAPVRGAALAARRSAGRGSWRPRPPGCSPCTGWTSTGSSCRPRVPPARCRTSWT